MHEDDEEEEEEEETKIKCRNSIFILFFSPPSFNLYLNDFTSIIMYNINC